eukprot:gnl/MRDRNA2_/MRDRNA2_94421_c0_seq1.p1 gnl/MRDRNA2_/MRDRNA2_94421_c0~~gnl/MRDRNA2_/MRDRNA2_94421_c0_seq1.p1  ORF type:complete len:165 (+),score=33.11 gnl/MRDRNA2_/MRDRNA2_94421_c0_seq1:99-593(+)
MGNQVKKEDSATSSGSNDASTPAKKTRPLSTLGFLKSLAEALREKKLGVEDAFDMYDTDGDRVLDRQEFIAMVKDVYPSAREKDVQILFSEADIDGNGTVDFNEFSRKFGPYIRGQGARVKTHPGAEKKSPSSSQSGWSPEDFPVSQKPSECSACIGIVCPCSC